MTKREMYAAVVEGKVTEEVVEAFVAEIEKLDAANAAHREKAAEKAVEKEVTDRTTAISGVTEKVTALETKVNDALGDGGNVATQIETAIGKLDAVKTAATGKAISKITQADGVITEIEELDVAGLIATAKTEAIEAAAADATTKANTAETNAKAYVDTAMTWGTF